MSVYTAEDELFKFNDLLPFEFVNLICDVNAKVQMDFIEFSQFLVLWHFLHCLKRLLDGELLFFDVFKLRVVLCELYDFSGESIRDFCKMAILESHPDEVSFI
jgi:hypothetical protein